MGGETHAGIQSRLSCKFTPCTVMTKTEPGYKAYHDLLLGQLPSSPTSYEVPTHYVVDHKQCDWAKYRHALRYFEGRKELASHTFSQIRELVSYLESMLLSSQIS